MNKISTTWFGDVLLPALYRAKARGFDIRSKSELLNLSTAEKDQDLQFWVSASAEQDIADTADVVDTMNEETQNVIKDLGLVDHDIDAAEKYIPIANLVEASVQLRKQGKDELARRLSDYTEIRAAQNLDELTKLLWKSNLKPKEPEKATDHDVKDLAKQALKYLKTKVKESESILKDAVEKFLDELYFSDISFQGELKPAQVFAATSPYDARDVRNLTVEVSDAEVNSSDNDQYIPTKVFASVPVVGQKYCVNLEHPEVKKLYPGTFRVLQSVIKRGGGKVRLREIRNDSALVDSAHPIDALLGTVTIPLSAIYGE